MLRLYGLQSSGVWYARGRASVVGAAYAASLLAFAGLLLWQFSAEPALVRPGQSREAIELARDAVRTSGIAGILSVEAIFTGAEVKGQPALIATVEVYPEGGVADDLSEQLRRRIQDALTAAELDAVPFVRVSVLEPPAQAGP